MDAHFHEYLGAIAGMQELYAACQPEATEFHDCGGATEAAELVLADG